MAAILCPAVPQGSYTPSKKKRKEKRILGPKLFDYGTVQFAVNRAGYCAGPWEPHRPGCRQLRYGASFTHCHSLAMKNRYICTGRGVHKSTTLQVSGVFPTTICSLDVWKTPKPHIKRCLQKSEKSVKVKKKMFGRLTCALPSTGPRWYYSTTRAQIGQTNFS